MPAAETGRWLIPLTAVPALQINNAIGNGDVQVVADAAYQENGIIYATTDASDIGIWRWTIGLSTSWEQIDKSMTT